MHGGPWASELASGNHAEVTGTSIGFWEYLCSFQTSGVFLETLLPRMGLWHSKHLNTPYGLCSWLSFDVAKVTVVHHKSTPLHQWSMWRYLFHQISQPFPKYKFCASFLVIFRIRTQIAALSPDVFSGGNPLKSPNLTTVSTLELPTGSPWAPNLQRAS